MINPLHNTALLVYQAPNTSLALIPPVVNTALVSLATSNNPEAVLDPLLPILDALGIYGRNPYF